MGRTLATLALWAYGSPKNACNREERKRADSFGAGQGHWSPARRRR